jgi:ABC-2 type transport system ATP-binding protein
MSALAARDAIQTIGVTKRFGRTLALDQLDLTVEAGEVFGFLGPNGAGKSTTIRLLLGHLRPTAGQAWIFGDASGDAAAAHRHSAYVPADVALWPALTGAETLELLADIRPGINRRYRDELVQRFELEVDRRCGTYSTGNRQKVALVVAFASDVPLLILDEPTAGLDPLMEQQFLQCIAGAVARGQTVFLSSHHLAEVEAVCQRVGILRDGRLMELADLSDLRRLSFTEVDMSSRGAPPDLEQLSTVPGVSNLHRLSLSRLTLTLTGPCPDRGARCDHRRAGGANLRLTEALAGALNVAPVVCLGAAQVAIGWAPHAVLALGTAPAVGGFLLAVLVDTFDWPNWLAQLSPFAHQAWVPATAPDWVGAAGMIGVSVLLAGLGIAGFARRDLRG